MGTVRIPESARLFVAVMVARDGPLDAAMGWLVEAYGSAEVRYGPIAFGFTDYYASEMGRDLQKIYLVFDRPFDRALLPRVKAATNAYEQSLATDGNRTVNIDPGYLCRDKLVLASTKDFYHRLYLGDGIFGEVTLHFRGGRYRHFSWTYADYKTVEVQQMLIAARAKLVGQERSAKGGEKFEVRSTKCE